MTVDDQTRDLVVLVRNDRFVEELAQGQVRKRHPSRDHFFGAVGRNPGQPVSRPPRGCLGEQVPQVIKNVGRGFDHLPIGHGGSAKGAAEGSTSLSFGWEDRASLRQRRGHGLLFLACQRYARAEERWICTKQNYPRRPLPSPRNLSNALTYNGV